MCSDRDVGCGGYPVVRLGDVVVLVDAALANLWCFLWTTAPLLAEFCGLGLGVFFLPSWLLTQDSDDVVVWSGMALKAECEEVLQDQVGGWSG